MSKKICIYQGHVYYIAEFDTEYLAVAIQHPHGRELMFVNLEHGSPPIKPRTEGVKDLGPMKDMLENMVKAKALIEHIRAVQVLVE